MKVNLKRNWFGPNQTRFRVRNNPHQMPDDWKKLLPSDAQVVGEEAPEKEPEKETKASAKKPAPNAPDALTL